MGGKQQEYTCVPSAPDANAAMQWWLLTGCQFGVPRSEDVHEKYLADLAATGQYGL